MFHWNISNFSKRLSSVTRSSWVIRSRVGILSDRWRVLLYIILLQNLFNILERGTSYCRIRSPYQPYNSPMTSTMTNPHGRSLLESRMAPRIKHLLRGSSSCISYKPWNKNVIGGQRWCYSVQKVCNIKEFEIVTSVKKRSIKLTGTPSIKYIIECPHPYDDWLASKNLLHEILYE